MAVSIKRRGKFRSLTTGRTKTRSSFRSIAGRKVAKKELPRLQAFQQLKPLFKKARGRIKTAPAREALARKRTRAKLVKRERKLQASAIGRGALPSSNIYRLGYNPETEEMLADFNSGARYKAEGVSQDRFDNLVAGRAVCKTKGANRYGSWFIGKSPSLGAAYWKYIRRANIKVTCLWVGGKVRP